MGYLVSNSNGVNSNLAKRWGLKVLLRVSNSNGVNSNNDVIALNLASIAFQTPTE